MKKIILFTLTFAMTVLMLSCGGEEGSIELCDCLNADADEEACKKAYGNLNDEELLERLKACEG